MGEYGRIVGESSGAVGGRGGSGSSDLGGDVMGALSDLVDQVATLPTEVLVVVIAIVLVGGLAMSFRTS